jgi:hypothetical protein
MLAKSDIPSDSTVDLEIQPAPRSPWRVVEVAALPDYRLRVKFRDGLVGIVDMKAAIFSPSAGVFASLRDEKLFERVCVETGAPIWPGEIDIAPDAIYDGLRSSAEGVYGLGSTAE